MELKDGSLHVKGCLRDTMLKWVQHVLLGMHDLKGVVNDPEGLDNVMQISLRLVKRLCEILSMTGNLIYPTSSQLNSEDRVSIRKNEEFTQQRGFIVNASTSIWLPHSLKSVFNFLKDVNTRCQACLNIFIMTWFV